MSRPQTYRRTYRLRTAELNADGQVSTVALSALLLESANLHAHRLGVSLELLVERGYTWFLSRFHLRMERFPSWRDAVTVETWPAEVESLFAVRDYRLFDKAGELLGLATSHWILIDIGRHRPVRRLPPFLLPLHPEEPVRALPTDPKRLPPLTGWQQETTTRVRRADLDQNGHLNAVVQMELLLEATPEDLMTTSRLRELVVEFKSEGKGGEALVTRAGKISNADRELWLHDLLSQGDDRLIARAQMVWVD